MNIKLINKEKTGELIFEGRLDATATKEVQQPVMDIAKRFDTVVLNLEKLEYIASNGLTLIKDLQYELEKRGGQLIVKNASPMMMEIFEMNGFVGFLNFEK